MAAHNFSTEAEETYRLGTQIWPANPESVTRLASLLAASGRAQEAQQLLDDFAQKYAEQKKAMEEMSSRWKLSIKN